MADKINKKKKDKLVEKEVVGKSDARSKSSRRRKEAYVAIFVVALILIFIASYYFFHNLGKVEYKDLVFTKEMFGKIEVYRYTYHFNTENGPITYNFYVRNNPAKNKVPIYGEIILPEKDKTVYISINSTGLTSCPTSRIAIAALSGFLADNKFTVKAGTPDKEEAASNNLSYIQCGTHPGNAAISISSGNETRIDNKDFCYKIQVNNCEILQALEKFEVETIVQAKNRTA